MVLGEDGRLISRDESQARLDGVLHRAAMEGYTMREEMYAGWMLVRGGHRVFVCLMDGDTCTI